MKLVNLGNFHDAEHAIKTALWLPAPLYPRLAICLSGPVDVDLALQRELFFEVLDELDLNDDLINQILEKTLEDSEAGIQFIHPLQPDESAGH